MGRDRYVIYFRTVLTPVLDVALMHYMLRSSSFYSFGFQELTLAWQSTFVNGKHIGFPFLFFSFGGRECKVVRDGAPQTFQASVLALNCTLIPFSCLLLHL